MWLFTPFGFFSVVEKPSDKAQGTLTVRARVREDLDRLRETYLPELGSTIDHAGTDYAFRATAPRDALALAMSRIIMDIHYGNFKNEVRRVSGSAREHVYHEVWGALYTMQQNYATQLGVEEMPDELTPEQDRQLAERFVREAEARKAKSSKR